MARYSSELVASNWGGLTAANVVTILIPFVFPTLVVGGLTYWLCRVWAQPAR